MWRHWTLGAFLCVVIAMPICCQTTEWGSGETPEKGITSNGNILTTQRIVDDPKSDGTLSRTSSYFEMTPDNTNDCSAHFYTNQVWARNLRAYKEELNYLKAIQLGNQAVVENLMQFVGAEMAEQSYQEVIHDNVVGIKEDLVSCSEVVQKAEKELQSQLEGDNLEATFAIHQVREGSQAFEDMFRATADMASQLESSARVLQVALTQQLRKSLKKV